MSERNRWKAGDVIRHEDHPNLCREIVDVMDGGYGWKHPDPDGLLADSRNYYLTEETADPFLEQGWELASEQSE